MKPIYIAWLFVLGACSLTLDLGATQCKVVGDCLTLTKEDETYVCNGGICERQSCQGKRDGDGYCRAQAKQHGPNFATSICAEEGANGAKLCLPGECVKGDECAAELVCDAADHRCIKPGDAACLSGSDKDCERYPALPLCVDRHCMERECTADASCKASSPTATCRRGRCVDAVWGCLDEELEEPTSSEPVTYIVEAYNVVSNTLPEDVTVKVCGGLNDVGCVRPLDGATVEFDYATNHIRVHGLAPGTKVHMQVSGSGLFNTDFTSQRLLSGKQTDEVAGIGLIPTAFIPALAAAVDAKVSDLENNATAVVQMVSCEEQRAPGVRFATTHFHMSDGVIDTVGFYISEGNHPLANAVETDNYGVAGFVNLDPDAATTIEAYFGERKIASHAMVPRAGWITIATLYPGHNE